MKKIIIFGAGNRGEQLLHIIQKFDMGKVEMYCDNNLPVGSYRNGLRVIRPNELPVHITEDTVIYISSPDIVETVSAQLGQLGIGVPIYMVPRYVYSFQWNEDCPFLVRIDIEKPILPYLECGIVEHCNLNCKGCNALSNVSDKEFLDLNKYEQDLVQLSRLFSGIQYFKLLGGEPLLHPEIEMFIKITRKYFPGAEIVVHSNGLLIPKMKEELFYSMNYLNASFIFTAYPPTMAMKREIIRILDMYGVKYKFVGGLTGIPVTEFRKLINLKGDYDPNTIYQYCGGWCINLVKGTLSCAMGFEIEKLEKKFNVEICKNKWERCVDIYTTEMNGWEIREWLNHPSEICAYCSFFNSHDYKPEDMFEWQPMGKNKAKLEDWVC